MENKERDFKGVWIDKEVWLDTRLNALEKIILVEIDSLDNEITGCYASNEYLAQFCQCSETKISTAIKKLIELDYIYLKSFDGRQRILKSRLSKNERQDLNNLNADFKNVKENNISNNKVNNKVDKEIYTSICDYLNEKAGTNYRASSRNTQSHINARLNEKYTLEDFKQVIDNKVAQWKDDAKMCQYLRPQTLFGSNFESYLNEKPIKTTNTKYTKEQLNSLFCNLD